MDRRSSHYSICGGSVIIEDRPSVGDKPPDCEHNEPAWTLEQPSRFAAPQMEVTSDCTYVNAHKQKVSFRSKIRKTSYPRVLASSSTGQQESYVHVNGGNDSSHCVDSAQGNPVETNEYLVIERQGTPENSYDLQDKRSHPFLGRFLSRKIDEIVSMFTSFRRISSSKDAGNDSKDGLEGQASATEATSDPSSNFAQCQALLSKLTEIFEQQGLDMDMVTQHNHAQRLMDLLQAVLDSPEQIDDIFKQNIILNMQRLSTVSGCFPRTYVLEPITPSDDDFYASGTFGEVYRAKYKGAFFCVKRIGPVQSTKDQLQKLGRDLTKEAILWGQLRHPHVVPFYGICEGSVRPCLVSPWMEKGDVTQYLKGSPDANRYLLVKDVANGLEYLHSKTVIHGDLKGANVLIGSSGRAQLADFGLYPLFDFSAPNWAAHLTAGTTNEAYRWQAPELLGITDSSSNQNFHNTKESDVYAWACVCYEIFTGHIPFHHLKSSIKVLTELQKGAKPEKPPPEHASWMTGGLTEDSWTRLEDAWGRIPSLRPTMQQLVLQLESQSVADDRPNAHDYDSPSKQHLKDRRSPLLPTLQSIHHLLESFGEGPGH